MLYTKNSFGPVVTNTHITNLNTTYNNNTTADNNTNIGNITNTDKNAETNSKTNTDSSNNNNTTNDNNNNIDINETGVTCMSDKESCEISILIEGNSQRRLYDEPGHFKEFNTKIEKRYNYQSAKHRENVHLKIKSNKKWRKSVNVYDYEYNMNYNQVSINV